VVQLDFSKKLLFLDGAMGSMLQKYGMKPGEASDTQNLINGSAVVDIHRKYIKAGADILTANTFGAYTLHHDNADELIKAAVDHIKAAMKAENTCKLIALDMGPSGQLLEPYGDLTYEECQHVFLQAAQTGAKAGADLILIETMSDINEMKAAISAAKTTGLPVIASMTFDKVGRTMMGVDIESMVAELEMTSVDAIGMNCGYGPELYEALLPQLTKLTTLPILVQPNAGLPELADGKSCYTMTPQSFAQSMKKMASLMNNKGILGGCCGTTPEHIKKMVDLCRG